MKKALMLVVACLLLAVLVACGKGGASAGDDYALSETNLALAGEVVALADGYLDGAAGAEATLQAVEERAGQLDKEGGGRDGRLELETHLVALQRALSDGDAADVERAREDIARLAGLEERSSASSAV